MTKVNICLSTYNGEKFLSEQLESIIAQTYREWTLLIRDDGSTDGTFEIIQDFCKKDARIHCINPNDRHNIGGHRSYFELTKFDSADYYMLAAQDDVLKKDKLKLFLSEAQKSERSLPTVWYSNADWIDENGSAIPFSVYDRAQTLIENMTGNKILGASVMFNDALCQLWQFREVGAEDSYLALLALTTGTVVFIPTSTLFYRRHSANWSVTTRTIKKFWEAIDISQRRAGFIAQDGKSFMSQQNAQCLTDYSTLSKKSFFKRLKLIRFWKYKRDSFVETWLLRALLLTNFGNNY